MNLEEKQLTSENIFHGRVVNLFVDDIQLSDGSKSIREYVKHSGGSAVLLIKDDKVLMVKQYRYCYHEEVWEIPAGKLENGEDPAVAAKRELEEETGFVATELVKFFTLYPTPGYTDEKLHIYWAKQYTAGTCHLDDGEFLNVEFLPLKDVVQMIENGTIRDAKTVAAILKYQLLQK